MSSDVLVTTPAQRQTEPHAEAVSRNRRQQATFRKVLAAAMATLREKSYADLTVRLVAARAKVAPATAYTYFSSKNHLIAEVYLDLVRQVPCVTDVNVPMPIRVTSSLRHLALVVADEPEIGAACTAAPRSTAASHRRSDLAPIPVPCSHSRWRSSERSYRPAAAPSPTTRSPIDSGTWWA
ncbi:TetR family transcriptional regulator [Mycobacterium tuberculosis]|nr:TetR family transcriptional regulator [Mycobacterium tuberculosis]